MSAPSRIAMGVAITLLSGIASQQAFAQAWVGPGQSLSTSLDYSYGASDRIVEDVESTMAGEYLITNHTVAVSAEYTPIDKLAVQLSIPIMGLHYDLESGGRAPAHGRYDDGDLHWVLQDLRLQGRYMVLENPVAISPHLGFSVPMTNYETVGYASAGRGLKQLHLGLSIGKYFQSGVPDLYVHGTYEFSLVEKLDTGFEEVDNYGQNRSDIKALVGYYILDTLEVNLAMDMRIAHGGLNFSQLGGAGVPEVLLYFHDPVLAEEFFMFGGGLSYEFIEGMTVSAFTRFFLSGVNTRNSNVFGLGLGWDVM